MSQILIKFFARARAHTHTTQDRALL